jgi:hypothetical protein
MARYISTPTASTNFSVAALQPASAPSEPQDSSARSLRITFIFPPSLWHNANFRSSLAIFKTSEIVDCCRDQKIQWLPVEFAGSYSHTA